MVVKGVHLHSSKLMKIESLSVVPVVVFLGKKSPWVLARSWMCASWDIEFEGRQASRKFFNRRVLLQLTLASSFRLGFFRTHGLVEPEGAHRQSD